MFLPWEKPCSLSGLNPLFVLCHCYSTMCSVARSAGTTLPMSCSYLMHQSRDPAIQDSSPGLNLKQLWKGNILSALKLQETQWETVAGRQRNNWEIFLQLILKHYSRIHLPLHCCVQASKGKGNGAQSSEKIYYHTVFWEWGFRAAARVMTAL